MSWIFFVIAAVVSIGVGRELDRPLKIVHESRAMLSESVLLKSEARPLFSPFEELGWPKVEQHLNLSAPQLRLREGQFLYPRSTHSQFVLKDLKIALDFPSDQSYFEIWLGEDKNGAYIINLTPLRLVVQYAVTGSDRVDVATEHFERAQESLNFEILFRDSAPVISINQRISAIALSPRLASGRISLATNLIRDEIKRFSLSGTVAGSLFQDAL